MNKTITNRKAYHKLGRATISETSDVNVKETKLKIHMRRTRAKGLHFAWLRVF